MAFLYGFLFGAYKVFPFNQLMAAKHYVETKFGSFESVDGGNVTSVEVQNTFLQRLLLKKVQLGQNIGSGGGIFISGDVLFVVTNKGQVFVFNMDTQTAIESGTIPRAPMNFDAFIASGHPYQNDFRMPWFRVNGVHAESGGSGNHTLFISHNGYIQENDCITHNVSRLDINVSGSTASSTSGWETIFTATPCIEPVPENWLAATPYSGHISGGEITTFDENTLLVTVGDYNRHGLNNAEMWAMDDSNPYGKYILMDKETGEWSVFARGTRNPSGLHIDGTGTIWSVENGPMAGDEMNIVERNENYGWPMVSNGLWYDLDYDFPGGVPRGQHSGYISPVFSWIPAVAPSGIIRMESTKFELWQGDLLVTTMRDQSIRRIRLDDAQNVDYDERIELGHRIRDIATLPDDTLVLFTDDGYLIFIDDGGVIHEEMGAAENERIARLEGFGNLITGTQEATESDTNNITAKAIFDYHCAVCHGSGTNAIGPHLDDIYGRQIGSLENFNYSETLRSDSRTWAPPLMRTFLTNPDSEFAGTTMPKANLKSAEADSLIRYLENL
ncbi:PQQ-dependent sugar dehydrogenase [Rhodohalobacter mucosus]|uniref:Cytochrome c domain-containing protein n=1 Tax=Rhodohalobacter mucosus TaxID=2079485 RepID=A0A316TTN0_9BACT|nr:PQQ-dependent sugar dehydrogenase [Rhodohalobacter mucosus]PWN07790.1 hypothetical protein DDZ15_01900 [Rhodohalobacter mucosus]